MLEARYERVQRTLGLLGRLREHVAAGRTTTPARPRARCAPLLRYRAAAPPGRPSRMFPVVALGHAPRSGCWSPAFSRTTAGDRRLAAARAGLQSRCWTKTRPASRPRTRPRWTVLPRGGDAHIAAEEGVAYPAAAGFAAATGAPAAMGRGDGSAAGRRPPLATKNIFAHIRLAHQAAGAEILLSGTRQGA